jgi:hypothetical protein
MGDSAAARCGAATGGVYRTVKCDKHADYVAKVLGI